MKLHMLWLLPLFCGPFSLFAKDSLMMVDLNDTIEQIRFSQLDIEQNEDYSSFSMLDSIVADFRVFLIGEHHDFLKSNTALQLKMLKYLHSQAGVDVLLIESGYSRGWIVNEYLQTGDSNLFNIIKTYSYKYLADFVKNIYEYNQSLDTNDKLKVVGIDIERNSAMTIKALSLIMPNEVPPTKILLDIESIRSLDGYYHDMHDIYNEQVSLGRYSDIYYESMYKFSPENTIEAIIYSFKGNRKLYEEYFGKKYELAVRLIEGLETEQQWREYEEKRMVQASLFREQYLYEEFLEVLEENPSSNFFGQFGRCHVVKEYQEDWCDLYHFNSLAGRINNSSDERIRGKLLSIASYYPKSYDFGENYFPEDVEIENILHIAPAEGLSLFKVEKDTQLINQFSNKFHYIILNQNDPQDEQDELEEEFYEYSDDYDSDMKYFFTFGYGFSKLGLSEINNYYGSLGLTPFPLWLPTYSAAITFGDEGATVVDLFFKLYEPSNAALNDSTEIGFSGYSLGISSGTDLVSSGILDVTPTIGLAYSQLKLNLEKSGSAPADSEGFFGENVDAVYKNPAFNFDFALNTKLNIKFLSLGLRGGYQLDVSNKNWKTYGDHVNNSPGTSLSGFYGLATLSFFINNDQ